MTDRGIKKWQPFNSITSSNEILIKLNNQKKPILFPEELELLNEEIKESYYAKNIIELTIYEENQIRIYTSIITKINASSKTITLKNNKTISFSQILHIKTI